MNDLEERLSSIEEQIADLEAQASGYADYRERFVIEVTSRFSRMMEASAKNEQRNIEPSMLDEKDIIQEIYLYMLRFNAKAYARFATNKVNWQPYLRRTIRNCIVNLKGYYNRPKRKRPRMLDITTFADELLDEEQADYKMQYDSLVKEIRSQLTRVERRVFDVLVDPPRELLAEARFRCEGKLKVSHDLIGEFLNLSTSRISNSISRIRVVTKEICLA